MLFFKLWFGTVWNTTLSRHSASYSVSLSMLWKCCVFVCLLLKANVNIFIRKFLMNKLHIDQLVNLKTTGSHGKAADIIFRTVTKNIKRNEKEKCYRVEKYWDKDAKEWKKKKMQMATSEFNDDWTVLTFVHHACECTEHVMQDWTKHL